MRKLVKIIASICAAIFVFFIGCSKEKNEFNKPATYWYQEMLKEIKLGNLESADNFFSSLQSEHINSPLLPDAMLILGKAHQEHKEFVLADYYFDEYFKRYGTQETSDYLTYLKIRAHYLAFTNYSKDQDFLENAILEAELFLEKHPESKYADIVKTMVLRLILGKNELNRAIANVYAKQHKKEAEELYLNRIDYDLEEQAKPTRSHIPWYVYIFNW
nr:outer membrane protein assembly factor BamD [Helicobacter anatolicus]